MRMQLSLVCFKRSGITAGRSLSLLFKRLSYEKATIRLPVNAANEVVLFEGTAWEMAVYYL